MQKSEFNHLMDGDPSKWANLPNGSQFANPQQLKDYVKENEEPIPEQDNAEIQKLILHRRSLGDPESKIRQLVKKTFNITVI